MAVKEVTHSKLHVTDVVRNSRLTGIWRDIQRHAGRSVYIAKKKQKNIWLIMSATRFRSELQLGDPGKEHLMSKKIESWILNTHKTFKHWQVSPLPQIMIGTATFIWILKDFKIHRLIFATNGFNVGGTKNLMSKKYK